MAFAAQGFTERDVVVTGGTGALGAAVVALLLERGAVCHIPVFDAAERTRAAFVDHPNVRFSDTVDLTDEAQVAAFYATVGDLSASIHIAGGFAMAPVAETSLADFRAQLDINLITAFLCCREAIKRQSAAGQSGGRLVNVAARPALEPRTGAGMAAYTASKAAVAAMTQAIAEEVAGRDIWVNAVVPSILDTPANRAAMPDADHAAWPKVADVAQTIAFLASPQNTTTRGALVPVYGRS